MLQYVLVNKHFRGKYGSPFIIINIKNSTRDIGIYMSLGMSGFKISMIYMFQVLIISLISSIVSCALIESENSELSPLK